MASLLTRIQLTAVKLMPIIPKKPHFLPRKCFCSSSKVSYLPLSNGNELAYRATKGDNPGVIFCPGFQSNMEGVKAMALEEYCKKKGLSFVRFDYQGCGQSTGDIRKATLSDWRSDVLTVLDQLTAGPQIIVGSSMGGWLMLATALERAHRIHALVGIATSAHFPKRVLTNIPKEIEDEINQTGIAVYSSENMNYILTQTFLDEAATHSLTPGRPEDAAESSSLDITCPVHLLHGMQDAVVPYETSVQLAQQLWSQNVQLVFSKTSDHRFSQPNDVQLLFETLELLVFGQADVRDLALSSWSSFSLHSPASDHLVSKAKVLRKY